MQGFKIIDKTLRSIWSLLKLFLGDARCSMEAEKKQLTFSTIEKKSMTNTADLVWCVPKQHLLHKFSYIQGNEYYSWNYRLKI